MMFVSVGFLVAAYLFIKYAWNLLQRTATLKCDRCGALGAPVEPRQQPCAECEYGDMREWKQRKRPSPMVTIGWGIAAAVALLATLNRNGFFGPPGSSERLASSIVVFVGAIASWRFLRKETVMKCDRCGVVVA